MTEAEFEKKMDRYDLDDEYSEYIMDRSAGERIIGNGDDLIHAIESGDYYDGFKEMMVTK
jgi:hypothetical protein